MGEGRQEQDLGEGSCAVPRGFGEEGRLKRGVGWHWGSNPPRQCQGAGCLALKP